MDGDGLPAAAASVAAVLGDDDLLREIFLLLGFPNYLVHAALVSKRWLLHASDPAFLRRFRDRNPPRLLGFSIGYPEFCRFVPLPQPPELAAVSRRAASSCNDAFDDIDFRSLTAEHCRNGRLITSLRREGRVWYLLLSPLLSGDWKDGAAFLPPTPVPRRNDGVDNEFTEIFLTEDGGRDGIRLVNVWRAGGKLYAKVYVLRSGRWGVHGSAAAELELPYGHSTKFLKAVLPPVHDKVFLVTTLGYIVGLDLATASFFTLELPVGVGHSYKLSCAEGSGLYLVNADGFQLSVWHHGTTEDGNGGGGGGWLLVDKLCVREACHRLAGHEWVSKAGDFVGVVAVGDNAEFVFLHHVASSVLLCVHLKSRLVEKVYQRSAVGDNLVYSMFGHLRCSPFMMTWPPIFPALNGGHDQQG